MASILTWVLGPIGFLIMWGSFLLLVIDGIRRLNGAPRKTPPNFLAYGIGFFAGFALFAASFAMRG